MATRARAQEGFGLLELLMAMTVLNIGILALVAAFNSGTVAITKASRLSTGAALADQQMERFRSMIYTNIGLKDSTVTGADSTYKNDTALAGDTQTSNYALTDASAVTSAATWCSTTPPECNASRSVTGPDRHKYRVDTYITWYCSSGTLAGTVSAPSCTAAGGAPSRPVKLVTVVVRDALNATTLTQRPLARVASTFDPSTGCTPGTFC